MSTAVRAITVPLTIHDYAADEWPVCRCGKRATHVRIEYERALGGSRTEFPLCCKEGCEP